MRVVSLLASATEMLAELGCLEQLVGRSHECDYPPEVQRLPLVSTVQIETETSSTVIDEQIKRLARDKESQNPGALKALSIYALDTALLQQLQPDVIFTQTQCEVCAVSERDVNLALQQVTGLQPRIVSLSPYRLADVWEDVLRVGRALEREERAQVLLQSYQQRLEHLQQLTSQLGAGQEPPRVAVLEWLDPLMGAGNWVPELLAYAGASASFGEVGLHSPWLSWQELRAADPDIIVLSPCGFPLERMQQDLPLLRQQATWQGLRAVRQQRVYAIDGNAYLNRSGPRLVESAEILARVIWGEQIEEAGIVIEQGSWEQIREE